MTSKKSRCKHISLNLCLQEQCQVYPRSQNMLSKFGKISLSTSRSSSIESIQKRALKIIYRDCSYDQALALTNENTLSDRRDSLCKKFMTEMVQNRELPLAFLVPLPMLETIPYNLRTGATQPTKPLKRTKRNQDFFTTKYHV